MASQTQYQQHLHELHANGVTLGTRELLYYQSHTRLLSLDPSTKVRAHLSGGYVSAIKGRGMEFDEARHYQPGDDIRAIDWRVTARTGKTHTKVYREERERPVFILCDFSQSMLFGTQFLFKSIQAAHFASLIGWNAVERGDKVGAIIFNEREHVEIKPKSRKRAALSLFHGLTDMHKSALAASPLMDSNPLEQSLMRLRRLARPGSLVCILSDFEGFNETCAKYLSDIKRHCEVHGIQLSDPMEYALPKQAQGRTLNLKSYNSSQTLTVATAASHLAYARGRAEKRKRIETLLSPHINKHVEISAGMPLLSQIAPQTGGAA